MIPKALKIQNFLSHDDSEIDFDRFKAALILGAYDSEAEQSNGAGKCLCEGTIITNAITGEVSKIEDISDIDNLYVYGLTKNFKLEPAKVTAVCESGVKNILEIEMDNGTIERVSTTHPVYTSMLKTIRAKDLEPGMCVAQPRHMFVKEPKNHYSIKEARLLAGFLAEGGLTTDIKFTNTDNKIIKQINKDIGIFGLKLSKHGGGGITYGVKLKYNQINNRKNILKRLKNIGINPSSLVSKKNILRLNNLDSGICLDSLNTINDKEIHRLIVKQHGKKIFRQFLSDAGMMGKKSIYKRLPTKIYECSNDVVGAFVGMFISCDGHVSNYKRTKRKEVSIGLGSEQLIDDLQRLLRQRGIVSYKRYKRVQNKFDSWVLKVSAFKDNILLLDSLISKHIVGEKAKKFKDMVNSYNKITANPNKDIIPVETIKLCKIPKHTKKDNGINLTQNQLNGHGLSRNKAKRYAEYFDNALLHALSDSDLCWVKVKSIKNIGKRKTYDIEIDNETKLYALNGFITHNSAIFESISWALFGRSRHKKVNGVVKWDKRACRVEFTFEVDGELYKVIRVRDKVLSDSDVVLEQWDGTQFNKITCDTNTATDKKISGIINFNYEVFVNSVYFKQDDISMFATTTPSKRKDILKSLLKMEKWDEYQKKAKDHAKTLSTKIDEQTNRLIPSTDLEKEFNNTKQAISLLKRKIKESNDKYSDINSEYISKKSTYRQYYGEGSDTHERLKKLQADFGSVKNRLSSIETETKKNDDTIKSNNSQISECKQKITLLKERIKAKNNANIDALRSNIIVGRTKEQILKDKLDHLKKDIKLSGERCDRCKKPLTKKEIEEIKRQHEEELKAVKEEYSQISEKLKRAEEKLKQKERDVLVGGKAEIEKSKTEAKISRLQSEIDNCITSNVRLKSEKSTIKIDDLKKEIGELKLKSDKVSEEKLSKEISALETSLKEIKRECDKLNIEYGSKVRRKNEIAKLQSEQTEIQKTIDKLKGEYSIYKKLRDYFGKDGIQSVIIENIIEELENYANDTLSKICNEPTSISIQTQKQLESGSWSETFDIMVKAGSRIDDFETFSGGEKFRISLALRLALSNILSKRMGGVIKFLLLDEVSSNLDNKGLEMFITIVKQLSEDMKVLVITHSERLKERFEDIIMVDKGPNGSRVSM